MVLADCNFKTGKYIHELSNPSYLGKIEIKIPKSSSYNKNVLKIYASKKNNISSNLKKRFYAKLKVYYPFGTCEYEAKVRQHGHQKDHISLVSNGKVVRSLDVALKSGNIMGSVNFKLLIPNTRNGINEILASLILKKSGFISPETFEVFTEINNVSSLMLFQEKAEKELLEKNLKRESAIFEGDQTLLWSYKDYKNFELEPISLSRLINDKWFLKGDVSQRIALSGFSKLQKSYLKYATDMEKNLYSIIDPNTKNNEIFEKFYFTLLAMNGFHALRPHNRKYYYNTFLSNFEPIYFDGMIEFNDLNKKPFRHNLDEILINVFDKSLNQDFINKLKLVLNSEELKKEFINRTVNEDKLAFFEKSINFYLNNINYLNNSINNKHVLNDNKTNFLKQKKLFRSFQKEKNIQQEIITDINLINEIYLVRYSSGNNEELSKKEISKLLSKNTINKKRAIHLTQNEYIEDIDIYKRVYPNFDGVIKASSGMQINLDINKKSIKFIQSKNNDWVLIENADLSDWNIKFIGKKFTKDTLSEIKQNFNEYGLTGCLTIYESKISSLNLEIENGKCEDSLNIISSTGSLNNVFVKNAYSDAVDVDFSNITILNSYIINSGNDCLDFSGGKYLLKKILVKKCGDKGISIGEKSKVIIKELNVDNSKIGVSTKDFSDVKIEMITVKNSELCAEVKQKKQEFGGAFLSIKNLKCDGNLTFDQNSILLTNNL